MTVQQVEVVITDDVLQDRVVIDDPTSTVVVEVQLPGVQGPPGSGSSAVLPSGGTAGQVLSKTGSLDANIAWSDPAVTTAALAFKLAKKNNGNVALDPEDDSIASFRVSATDGGAESGWIDKLQFWFSENGTDFFKTWFVDKYNQLRARAARDTESAFIAYPKTNAATVDIFKVANADGSTTFVGVSKTAMTATVPVIAPNLVPAIVLAHGGSVPGGTAAGTLVFELDA